MSDVVDRITARLDAMEAAARDSLSGDLDRLPSITTRSGDRVCFGVTDPDAVLRMVAGLRAVVALHRPVNHGTLLPEWWCPMCGTFGLCPTVVAIAAMWPDTDPRPAP